jgi:hypothetical protein
MTKETRAPVILGGEGDVTVAPHDRTAYVSDSDHTKPNMGAIVPGAYRVMTATANRGTLDRPTPDPTCEILVLVSVMG